MKKCKITTNKTWSEISDKKTYIFNHTVHTYTQTSSNCMSGWSIWDPTYVRWMVAYGTWWLLSFTPAVVWRLLHALEDVVRHNRWFLWTIGWGGSEIWIFVHFFTVFDLWWYDCSWLGLLLNAPTHSSSRGGLAWRIIRRGNCADDCYLSCGC